MEILDWRLAFFASNAELRLPDNQAVSKRLLSGLVLGIDGEADRSQLHFDDRMMPVASLWGGAQTGQGLRFGVGQHAFKGLVRAVATLHSRLLAHAANPLVGAGGCYPFLPVRLFSHSLGYTSSRPRKSERNSATLSNDVNKGAGPREDPNAVGVVAAESIAINSPRNRSSSTRASSRSRSSAANFACWSAIALASHSREADIITVPSSPSLMRVYAAYRTIVDRLKLGSSDRRGRNLV